VAVGRTDESIHQPISPRVWVRGDRDQRQGGRISVPGGPRPWPSAVVPRVPSLRRSFGQIDASLTQPDRADPVGECGRETRWQPPPLEAQLRGGDRQRLINESPAATRHLDRLGLALLSVASQMIGSTPGIGRTQRVFDNSREWSTAEVRPRQSFQ